MKLNTADLKELSGVIRTYTGISIGEDKAYFLESRLSEIAAQYQIHNFSQLRSLINGGQTPKLRQQIIDAITVNESFFFRDRYPFDILTKHLVPDVVRSKAESEAILRQNLGSWFSQKRLHIWSTACAYGQEPYSIAMALRESIADIDQWEVRILATDISSAAVERAMRGEYSDFEISRGLDEHIRRKYFERDGDRWRIIDRIKNMVSFRQFNLQSEFTGIGFFDVIFCRNVAIYFDEKNKRQLFSRFLAHFNHNGWLILGSSESVVFLSDAYKMLKYAEGIVYQVKRSS